MANSVVSICNLALSRFGQGKISVLTEASREAVECALNYEPTRDSILREFPWSFAKSVVALAEVTYPVIGWDYTYGYPSDCLNVRRVYGIADAANANKEPYDIVTDGTTRYIVSNLPTAQLEYTARIIDPVLFDPQFVEALSYKLASVICIPLSGSSQRKGELYQEYKIYLSSAQLSSAQESNNQPLRTTAYVDGRR